MLEKEDYERYSRHIILPLIGAVGQAKLKQARVCVVGAGGLGVPVLQYLAAAGVGTLGIVDHDKIERSNLQRQVMYKDSEVGKSKAEVAAAYVKKQNPTLTAIVHSTWIDSSNALEILRQYDLIIDGTDNFPTRYLLNDAAVILGIPYVYGSIYRWEGQASVFNYKGGPNYRDLFPEPPSPELVPNCSEGGVLGVLPGIVGSMQALEAIKIITGAGEVLSGRLLTLDTLSNQYRSFRFRRREDSPVITELIDYKQFCNPGEVRSKVVSMKPEELEEWRNSGKRFQLVDVREAYEYDIVNIGGNLMPRSSIEDHIGSILRDVPVVIHCRSGKRSEEVIRLLSSKFNFSNLINLEGGLLRYAEDVDRDLVIY